MCCNRVCWGGIIPSTGRWWFSSRGTGLWRVFFPLVVSIESGGNFFFVHCQDMGWFMLPPPLLTWLASVFMYQSINSFISYHTSWFVCIHITLEERIIFYLNDDLSSCSNLQYQTQINCLKTKTTLKVAAKHLSK